MADVTIDNVLSDKEYERTYNDYGETGWGGNDSDDYNRRVRENAMMLKYERSREILKELEAYMNSDNCSIVRKDEEEKIVINF